MTRVEEEELVQQNQVAALSGYAETRARTPSIL
jgi:hypothetical protein